MRLGPPKRSSRPAYGQDDLTRMFFPPNYATSRARFREAAQRLRWDLHAQKIEGKGPDGEELTIDAAISPIASAKNVVVISSGLHGVEGPFGTAVQLAVMDEWQRGKGLPSDVRCVFLHGLNPYGYAWERRVDANNVDPNRNLLLPGDKFAGSPKGYRSFDGLLNPQRPPLHWDRWTLRAWWAWLRHGLPALKEAMVVGQYEFPKGLFFGGNEPGATHRVLGECLRQWLGECQSAIHLDFHSGLGRWGSYTLLLDGHPLTKNLQVQLDRWFGAGNYEQDDSKGVAYQPRGSFGSWCMGQNLARNYLYFVAEFGTYGSVAMLGGLRAENQAHHWGQRDGVVEQEARARLKELFCPADANWRSLVLERGKILVNQAVEAMAG